MNEWKRLRICNIVMQCSILCSDVHFNPAPHQGFKKIKSHSDNSSTMNYKSIRATSLLKYTQAAGAIWGCVKTTAKTNQFIQLWIYFSALPMFLLYCTLSSYGSSFSNPSQGYESLHSLIGGGMEHNSAQICTAENCCYWQERGF